VRILSADERQRASRLLLARDRNRFIAARARLRQILARYVAMPPEALIFGYGAQGKPALSLAAASPFFSLSHSGGVAALGVTHGCEIGIDIEQVRAIDGGVAKRFFSTEENTALAQLHEEDWLEGFYRCWTRKEAVIKAIGTGLTLDLASLEVSLAPAAPTCVLRVGGCRAGARQWSLADLTVGPGIIGAVAACTRGAGLQVRPRQWHPLP
jgi:4'-phosphopantetheinyl transferase